jgi:citrate synthase
LKQRLAELIPEKQEEVKKVRQDHGSKSLGTVTVDMVCESMVFISVKVNDV